MHILNGKHLESENGGRNTVESRLFEIVGTILKSPESPTNIRCKLRVI